MARKAIFKHATQVDTSAYPDDGSSPVGSDEWNEAPDAEGMLGFTPATATITIASGVATVTDTVTVVAAESGTSDTLDKLAITNTSQYDLIYLFADTGDTITLTNTSSPSASGHIKTVSDANETLSSTTPTILIRKGNYWYGYGGGVVNAVSDIGDVTISSIGSGELLKWNGSAWINQTLAEAGIAAASHTQAASTITDFDTEVANNTAVAANTAKVTNATHTGDVTGSTALSIASDAIDGSKIADDSIDSEHIVDGSVDLAHMSVNSIDSDQYVDGSIDLAHMSANSIDSDQYVDGSIDLAHISTGAKTECLSMAVSDNTTALATGTVFTFYMPYAMTLTDIKASVLTAPTGAELIVDVHEAGTTIMSTHKLDIDVDEFHTSTAGTQPVLTDTALANNAKIEIIVDQVGSTVAGAGLVVYLIGYQT